MMVLSAVHSLVLGHNSNWLNMTAGPGDHLLYVASYQDDVAVVLQNQTMHCITYYALATTLQHDTIFRLVC